MGIVLIILDVLADVGLLMYTGYLFSTDNEKLAILMAVVNVVYTLFILYCNVIVGYFLSGSGSSRSGDFECDAGDMDCGDVGGGVGGGSD